MSNDAHIELLNGAIALSGLSARAFAVGVLAVDERTVRRWISGEREIPGPVRVICGFIIRHPHQILEFVQVSMRLKEESEKQALREFLATKRTKKKT